MDDTDITRRRFLLDSKDAVSATCLALYFPLLEVLASCAHDGTGNTHLTSAEARAMRAFAAQIIPSDAESAGAEEAGAVAFVDRALGTSFFAGDAPVIRAGLADLDSRARRAGGHRDFAALNAEQQVAIMRQIEHNAFFSAARALVVIGTFADPSYGGNRNASGWTMIGIDHRASYTAPYGWYDAKAGAA
jgi:hypothetical protein